MAYCSIFLWEDKMEVMNQSQASKEHLKIFNIKLNNG